MEIIRDYSINGSREKRIALDIFYEKSEEALAVVIFSHGFKGFKDWGHFNLVAQEMAKAGFLFVKFNFSYNGTTLDQPSDFADLEAFGQNNLSTELEDLSLVIDFILAGKWGKQKIDKHALKLLGHSRGGGISILQAARDSRVQQLCTWAAVNSFDRFFDESFIAEWEKEGVLYIPNSRTNQEMPMYKQYLEDLRENSDLLDIQKAAKQLRIPYLIVHGSEDPTVTCDKALQLKSIAPNSTLFTVPGANHVFGAKHPYLESSLPEDAQKVLEKTIAFFKS